MTTFIIIEWTLLFIGVAAALAHTPDDLPRQHGEGEWVRGEDFNHSGRNSPNIGA